MRLVKIGPTDLRVHRVTRRCEGRRQGRDARRDHGGEAGRVRLTLQIADEHEARRRASGTSTATPRRRRRAKTRQLPPKPVQAAKTVTPPAQGSEAVKRSGARARYASSLARRASLAAAIDGVAPTPASSELALARRRRRVADSARGARRHGARAPSIRDAARSYTLAEVVDVALRNSPATRLSWTQARAAADVYGSTRGPLFPTITAGVAANRSLQSPTPGRPPVERTQYGPTLSLHLHGARFRRAHPVDRRRATDGDRRRSHAQRHRREHDSLRSRAAAFDYLSTRAQRDAQKSAMDLATAALDAANERHRVGLATIADVLQAQTARSQAELQLQTLEGALQVDARRARCRHGPAREHAVRHSGYAGDGLRALHHASRSIR